MKSDLEIRDNVLAELKWEPNLDETQIGVIVEDGVVTLSGQVDDYQKKVAANKAAKRVFGVKAVAEDIEVKYGEDYKKTDKEIAKAAVKALEWNTTVPQDSITIFVEDGYIYLSGIVQWEYQKDAASWELQNLLGVKEVVNNIKIIPEKKTSNAEEQISNALERSVFLRDKGIRVQVDGSTVQLKGRVHSLWEKEEAEKTAFLAPGVEKVVNDIIIQSYPEFA